METAFIWAQDRNRVIGRDGKLPWRLADDLKFF
ncbi:dihydrofolate reductase [Lacticaseibacillus thailandensis]|nr:dihydrofolate reductase [Lacticaseibacillus thailandensis]